MSSKMVEFANCRILSEPLEAKKIHLKKNNFMNIQSHLFTHYAWKNAQKYKPLWKYSRIDDFFCLFQPHFPINTRSDSPWSLFNQRLNYVSVSTEISKNINCFRWKRVPKTTFVIQFSVKSFSSETILW